MWSVNEGKKNTLHETFWNKKHGSTFHRVRLLLTLFARIKVKAGLFNYGQVLKLNCV